ncbi:MAG: hypothetical protein BECKG1743F_GA0114225_104592 [Candidatus Kentron sp. G]|nr:MAG: hypothetical protein BECKG1743F_GA0114225_104592 [Candidatus Kentron sp. G]
MKNLTGHAAAIGVGMTLATALLFVAGWSYAGYWFRHFNLGLLPLGLPTEHYFMHGFRVLLDHGWWLLWAFAIILILWYSRPPAPPWVGWLVLPLIVMVFALFYRLGETSADRAFDRHRAAGFREYPMTRVWLTRMPDQVAYESPVLAGLAKELAAGEYRLLVESETSLFLIRPKPGGGMPTVEVPLRRVAAIRRIPVNPGIMKKSRRASRGKE